MGYSGGGVGYNLWFALNRTNHVVFHLGAARVDEKLGKVDALVRQALSESSGAP
jgi:hypothetical protein